MVKNVKKVEGWDVQTYSLDNGMMIDIIVKWDEDLNSEVWETWFYNELKTIKALLVSCIPGKCGYNSIDDLLIAIQKNKRAYMKIYESEYAKLTQGIKTISALAVDKK